MRRLSQELIDRLDLVQALDEETNSWRNQIPPEPWRPAVTSSSDATLMWIQSRLATGVPCLPGVVVNARKATIGTRPVPILGIADRVVYRALTKLILSDLGLPDRSPDAYKSFLHGPIEYALRDRRSGFGWNLGDVDVKYVVEADITAFYQYVDHDLLRHELEIHTGEIEAIDALVELLSETEGRAFGLPQLLDASDWLSDIYIQSVERDLLRRGLAVWRYNDDFRIACRSYTEALDSIERLEESARAVGLTMSDHKTYTPLFSTYFFKTTGRDISSAMAEVDPSDVEVIVTDYPDLDDEERIDAALSTLARLDLEPDDDNRIDLRRLTSDAVRDLRRAIGGLTRAEHPGAMSRLTELLILVPSLTPRLCEYMIGVYGPDNAQAVEQVVDTLVEHASLGDWQALWIVYTMRQLLLMQGAPARETWVRAQRERGRGRLLGAEAALALAEVGVGDFNDLDHALRSEPEALAPWHLLAMKAIAASTTQHADRARAVRDSYPLNKIILDI